VSERRVFDVLTIDRSGVDLYPLRSGVGLAEVTTFGRFLGGSPTNVAVAAARLGRRSAVITRTGPDPFGTFVRRTLAALGVDARYVSAVPGTQTPLTFCELFPPDDFPLYLYRAAAPDLMVAPDELDLDAIRDARVYWSTLTGLSRQPSRDAHLAAWRARGRRPLTLLDLDLRPVLWEAPALAREQALAALDHVTVAVGNLAECAAALGLADGQGASAAPAAAEALLARGVELAVVKRGPRGVLAMTASERVEVPAPSVTVVNGLGAGDAFGGALCHGLLAGWPLAHTLRYANAAGAIVASRLECATAMPTVAEVEEALDDRA
jgi:5-dehydro-2-deoxygluconokinase